MKKTLALFSCSLGIILTGSLWSAIAQLPPIKSSSIPIPIKPEILSTLKPITSEPCSIPSHCLGWDEQLWGGKPANSYGLLSSNGDSAALLASIDNSLRYLAKKDAIAAYQKYPIKEITLDRVRRSLLRFRQLVINSHSPAELQAAVLREFVFYQSVGNDGKGRVKFTSYYEPIYTASPVRTAIYKYPLYRLPPDFAKWKKPHPKRIDLEGRNGLLGNRSRLHGLEIVWFRDRFQAYMVHIQGSAQIRLTDGRLTSVRYAGGTDYPWTSIGKELAKDKKLPLAGLTLPKMIRYFHEHPRDLNVYLPRWKRFIFFQEAGGTPPIGSIHVPITQERSIATDKSLMPPGALALINTSFPYATVNGKLEYHTVNRFVLDQDAGSAIKGPGRVDYFMGVGELAGDRAGVTGGDGSLYYLLLK